MAAGATYTPIASFTVSTAQASYTFSSISGAYTDLVLVFTTLSSAGAYATLRINGDTGTSYSDTHLKGNGTTATSWALTGQTYTYLNDNGASLNSLTAPTVTTVSLMNYSNSTTYKTILSRFNSSYNEISANVSLWRSTSAITSITILTSTGTYAVGSTFALYGILAA